ncbi:carboxypeptidase-like regulatory domain-containing protein [Pedobacter sp. UBA4863]|uniref:carboxypeptidase-like regulatory domain-containing protein n=1 Tax=Pedobacter sp. UBA4863 TaxID=1947060 RepID=UPI0025D31262|nr:carboxypeptidase-like regulatory domain-containing protein [Pedobacter sp. UBA4863]
MKTLLTSFMALILFFGYKAPPTREISGTIVSAANGLALSNASIQSFPSKTHTTAGSDGKYFLKIPATDTYLMVSSIGFQHKKVTIGKANLINISLADDSKALHEIAIVDYATEKKMSLNGAVATVASTESLSGRVAGVPIADDISRSTSSTGAIKDRREDLPQSNQLTAGEWNDLENWDFWKGLMNSQDWSSYQQSWGFNTGKRFKITLRDKNNSPLPNYQVYAFSNGKALWKAQSNYAGIAELWTALLQPNDDEIKIVVASPNGEPLYTKTFEQQPRQLNIKLNVGAQKIKNLDVMFMVDATGSMGDEINYLKAELDDIVGRFNREDGLITRTGLVFYRDHGDEYIIRDFGFDTDLQKIKANLVKQSASGGGDFEEAVDEAMENAIFQQQWTSEPNSTKLMFMILDAPPHHQPDKIKRIQRSVKEAAAKGIILVPVVASGIDKSTEFLMRFMALSTNGTYVFITDHSGIGNSHLAPTVGQYKVEKLNQLLYRLTRKYTGLDAYKAKDLRNFANNSNER